MKNCIYLVLASLFFFSSCKECVKGDNNLVTSSDRSYPEGFDIIQSDLNYDVTIYQVNDSLPDAVAIMCDGNLSPYILTWVDSKNSTLHIELDSKHCIKPHDVEVYVYAHKVHGIVCSSSGAIYCDSLQTDNLTTLRVNNNGMIRMRNAKIQDLVRAELGGSGTIDLQGSARTGDYDNLGSGKVIANYMMLSGDCSAKCSGPGTISLYCDETLYADPGANGGIIYFYGNPWEIFGPKERVIPGN